MLKLAGRTLILLLLFMLVGLAIGTFTPVARAADDDSLAATTEVPWNPERPINARRPWEQAVLLPGRIVSLPLVGLGRLTDMAFLNLERTDLLTKVAFTARQFSERSGFTVRPAHFETRTGFGGAAALNTPFLRGGLRNRLRAETALTLREYHRTTLSVMGRPARLDYQYDWRPEERFYGVGLYTSEDSVSAFAWQTETVRASVRWAWNRDNEESDPRTEINFWTGPRSAVTRTGRDQRAPSFDTQFPELADLTLNRRIDHFIYGASFQTDWRTGAQRWSKGWRVKVEGERYDRPVHFLALKSGQMRGAQFSRFLGETEFGFSFMRDPRTLRFLVRVLDQGATSGGDRMMFSDMAVLGGASGLAGYQPGRFHDLDLLLTRVNYIFPLVQRLELDVHSEWGSVYPDVWGDAKLASLKNSYGVALRGRLNNRSFGSIGMDVSRESARLRLSFGTVE